jgi:hypothetical protein
MLRAVRAVQKTPLQADTPFASCGIQIGYGHRVWAVPGFYELEGPASETACGIAWVSVLMATGQRHGARPMLLSCTLLAMSNPSANICSAANESQQSRTSQLCFTWSSIGRDDT